MWVLLVKAARRFFSADLEPPEGLGFGFGIGLGAGLRSWVGLCPRAGLKLTTHTRPSQSFVQDAAAHSGHIF